MTSKQWEKGVTLPLRTFGPVTLTDIVRYQGASGDMNPMHHDDALARSAGYPEAFGVGMLNAGYLATFCTDLFGTETVRRFRTRFKGLVWRGEVLHAAGQVRELHTRGDLTDVEIDFTLTTQDGRLVVEGDAEFAIPSEIAVTAGKD
jgi:acyl dehydratase